MKNLEEILDDLRGIIKDAESASEGVVDEDVETEEAEPQTEIEADEEVSREAEPFNAEEFKAGIMSEVRQMLSGLMISNGGGGEPSEPPETEPQTIEDLDLL